MGIEPTQDGTSALLTVLKTAELTRTLPPPTPPHTAGEVPLYTVFTHKGIPLLKDLTRTIFQEIA